MRDPWTEFVDSVGDAEYAGYFERGAAPGTPGRWAVSYVDPEDRLVLKPGTSAEVLDEIVRRRRGRPAGSGWVGFVGFDGTSLFEPLLRRFPAGAPFPIGEWAWVRNLRRRPVPSAPRAPANGRRTRVPSPASDTLPMPRFERSVRRLRDAIGLGEAFQVVLSHRRTWDRPADLVHRATLLRSRERFAYFFYLRSEGREIIGASPESVLEVSRGGAYVSPIAGTRPRGLGSAPRRSLSTDPKELSEHRMLVDLARNDLGRISRPGSVRLVWQERNERFSRLEHLVSRVAGRLNARVGPWAALAATFPAGTVSGAPKIRATKLLRREEASWRGPYAGAVGLIDSSNDAHWALAIRTVFASGPRLYTAAGAGIVWRSEPRREYEETLTKLAQVESIFADGGRA
jgi:anthranilate/para-aminobenzoate synthase component I